MPARYLAENIGTTRQQARQIGLKAEAFSSKTGGARSEARLRRAGGTLPERGASALWIWICTRAVFLFCLENTFIVVKYEYLATPKRT